MVSLLTEDDGRFEGLVVEGAREEGGTGVLGIGRGGVGNNDVLSVLPHARKDILGIDKDSNVSCGRYSV